MWKYERITMIYILKNHSSSAKHIKNAAPFPP